MDEEASNLRSARELYLRRLIVQALLELESEIGEHEAGEFRDFKAAAVIRLFSQKPALHDAIPFDNEFYTKRLVPKIAALLNSEHATLDGVEIRTESDVSEAFQKVRKSLEDVIQQRNELAAQLQMNGELLQKTLRHEQWPLRRKLAQAEVDYTQVTAAIYEKKCANVVDEIHGLFRDYKYDKAIEALREKLEKESAELKRELDSRVKKHEIYQKALALNPDLDSLLEKFQMLNVSVKDLEKMNLILEPN